MFAAKHLARVVVASVVGILAVVGAPAVALSSTEVAASRLRAWRRFGSRAPDVKMS